ncbi:MAG TPA: Ig-like domain-containing protein, partial [Acidiphilium sp.]
MSQNTQQAGPDHVDRRPGIPGWVAPVAVAALGILAVLGLVFLGGKSDFAPTKPAEQTAGTIVKKLPSTHGPVFDTVRVDAGGNAVIAGRAAPGAKVTITANGKPIGTVTADSSGSFAFVTSKPLSPGGQQIALSEKLPDGQIMASGRSVTVSVPKAPGEGALAVLSSIGKSPSKVLTGQGPKPGTLGLGSVDYDGSSHAVIAGTAKPGAHVSLFLGKTELGTAVADSTGRWTMQTDHMPANPGTFRLEAANGSGTVTASMETAFAPRKVASLAPGHVVIRQGQCL